MMLMKKYISVVALFLLYPGVSFAHCPLCTIGAGALAVFAASLGVPSVIVAVFVGAFAMALGLWLSLAVKRKYILFQDELVASGVYAGTVLPLVPLLREYKPLYVSFLGEYGTTYAVDVYVVGILAGALSVLFAPAISKIVKKINNEKIIPFQGTIITFASLILTSIILAIIL